MSATILHLDEDIVVLNKPSGLLVHAGWGKDGDNVVRQLRQSLSGSTIHPVHRLDRATSGAMVVALNPEAARHLGEQFRHQRVDKRYLALVRGSVHEARCIDHHIARQPGGARVAAITHVSPLAHAPTQPRETSLVWATPQTGRTHQIRRHLKHLNHPLIGDVNYGKGPLNREARSRYKLHRLALHAYQLGFVHPRSEVSLTITAPLPPDLVEPLHSMGYGDALQALQIA